MKLSVLVYLTIVYKVQQFKNCITICFKMVALKLRKFLEHFIEFPITNDYTLYQLALRSLHRPLVFLILQSQKRAPPTNFIFGLYVLYYNL